MACKMCRVKGDHIFSISKHGTDVIFLINQRCSSGTEERDVYEELLTQQEIQGCLDFVNSKEWFHKWEMFSVISDFSTFPPLFF